MKIVVTDLTRFKNPDIRCVAGVDLNSGRCIRPMPYLPSELCRKLKMLPGAILEGKFSPIAGTKPPHVEDMAYSDLKFLGPASSSDFRLALMHGRVDSIEKGFAIALGGNRCIPNTHTPPGSLITIAVSPDSISVVRDKYGLKVHVTDQTGNTYRYMPITDLGFYEYAEDKTKTSADIAKLNNFVRSQKEVFVRVGLSRPYTAPDGRSGHWIQANGIYTFPDYFKEIRHS